MDQRLASQRWDAEYRAGRYVEESPLPFVDRIISVLQQSGRGFGGTGLYVGCGNGRNLVPLVEAGLRLYGLDISSESLRQLAARCPSVAAFLICGDFRAPPVVGPFEYIIAIQVLQHGLQRDVESYFGQAARLISPGGYLFVRVNSVSTEISESHTRIEEDDLGGLTVEYQSGPKTGLPVHFYSRNELRRLTADGFEPVGQLEECVMERTPPRTGRWAQWEGVWRRKGTSDGSA